MLLLDSAADWVFAIVALGLSGTVLVAAAIEAPPALSLPRTMVVLASIWASAFAAAAVVIGIFAEEVVAGSLLGAASLLAGAAGLWFVRCRRAAGNDDGGGGGGGGEFGPPDGPPPLHAIDRELWDAGFDEWVSDLLAAETRS
jgi:hypothetical protein